MLGVIIERSKSVSSEAVVRRKRVFVRVQRHSLWTEKFSNGMTQLRRYGVTDDAIFFTTFISKRFTS